MSLNKYIVSKFTNRNECTCMFRYSRFCVRVSLNNCDSSVVPSITLSILSVINTNFRSSRGGYTNHFYIKKSITCYNINTEKDRPTNN